MRNSSIPPRDPRATAEQEAGRLRAILEGLPWDSDAVRMERMDDGARGWRRGGSIYFDVDPTLSYGYWCEVTP